MNRRADVLLITVTEVESRAVLQTLQEHTGEAATLQRIGNNSYYHCGTISDASVWHALSGMGTGGLTGSQESIREAIEALRPSAVVMVGIAFGSNPAKQFIGDILVSEGLRLYELQRVGAEVQQPKITLRGSRPDASHWLLQCFKNANLSWKGQTVRFGLVLTGEKLVDNFDYREQLRSFEPEAIGGEMEGAGLYVVCQKAKIDWILVKGICDWADGCKETDKTTRQALAARNSTTFVLHTLTQVGLRRDFHFSGIWRGSLRSNDIEHTVCAVIWSENLTLCCTMTLVYEFAGAVTVVEERFSCETRGANLSLNGRDSYFLVKGNEGRYRLDRLRLTLSGDSMMLNAKTKNYSVSLTKWI